MQNTHISEYQKDITNTQCNKTLKIGPGMILDQSRIYSKCSFKNFEMKLRELKIALSCFLEYGNVNLENVDRHCLPCEINNYCLKHATN